VAGLPDARTASSEEFLGFVGIEAAARAVGVSPSAVRLWERQGLVSPARTRGGTRRYSADDLARLHAVRRLRVVDGLNAPAIRRLLDEDDGRPDPARRTAGGRSGAPPVRRDSSPDGFARCAGQAA
jgi:DNA-binding transcriptional MerR regulator